MTSGGLAGSPGGTGVSNALSTLAPRPISESEVASDARSVDGRLCSTTSAAKAGNRPRRTWSRRSAILGGQGVHREVESEGHEEKYRAVIDGGNPEDEPVGQRWGKVEPAVWRRRRSHSPTAPRCLRTARYGREMRDLRRTGRVSGWHRSKQTYKRERSGERCFVSRRTAV